jgi:MoxR-like ATPase
MNDQQVTAEGRTYHLTPPFLVLATQNPIDFHGTYPLPESQMDRFMLRMRIGYPDEKIEAELINTRRDFKSVAEIEPVICAEKIIKLQQTAKMVHIEKCISEYIVKIVTSTRTHSEVKFGASTRGSLMLACAARAYALIKGRNYVIPDDVRHMASYVLAHRIVLNSTSIYSGTGEASIIDGIISSIEVPV